MVDRNNKPTYDDLLPLFKNEPTHDGQAKVVPEDAELKQTFIAEMDAITKVEQVLKGNKNIIKITFKNGNNLQLDFGSNARERRVIFDALYYIKK